MTTELKMTPTRLSLLRAIDHFDVIYDDLDGSYLNTAAPRVVTTEVRRFIDAGWAQRINLHVHLTDAGRAALDADSTG